jgi:hypothetical protein
MQRGIPKNTTENRMLVLFPVEKLTKNYFNLKNHIRMVKGSLRCSSGIRISVNTVENNAIPPKGRVD